MENSSKVMAIKRGMAILPLVSQILSHNSKNFSNVTYPLYPMALKNLKQIIFEIKSVPTEYFEDLILQNNYFTDIKGDVNSYALLSVNSLVALSAVNESWLKIEACSNSATNGNKKEYWKQETVGFKNLETCDQNEDPYFIQCYAVSSIEKGFVIYVTNEKYFNIIQHFNMSVTVGPVFKVKVKKIDLESPPQVATILALAMVEPVVDLDLDNVTLILQKFFKTTKFLKMYEVFQVNLQKILPYSGLNYYNVEHICFKVIHIEGKSIEKVNNIKPGDIGLYVSTKNTHITVSAKLESFTPMVYTRYIPVRRRLGYKINLCPEGLDKYYSKLKNVTEAVLDGGRLQFKPMILMTGVRGSGKKTILNCITQRFGMKLYSVDCFDYLGLDGTILEAKISALVLNVKRIAPVILLMENIQLLGRDDHFCESDFAIELFKCQTEKLFEDCDRFPVIIVASSNDKKVEILPSVQRLFIQTISFELLKRNEISMLFKWLMSEVGMTCFPKVFETVVQKINGYSFSDLSKLVRLASKFQRLDKNLSKEHKLLIMEEHWEKGIMTVFLTILGIVNKHTWGIGAVPLALRILKRVGRNTLTYEAWVFEHRAQDSGSRTLPHNSIKLWRKELEILEALYSDSIGTAKVPSIHWEDVGGLEHLKEEITLALEFPTKYPELMDSGLRASGFLFFGPPGTGKTLMAKAVATEFNYNFLSVKGPELMNMYIGQSEKNVREVFRRAREAAPCVIFFDELDSLAPNRGRNAGIVTDRIVSQLLTEMDGLESNKGVFVIGATNRPDLVDPALLRPGRFDKIFYVGVCESSDSKLSVLIALTRRFSLGDDVYLERIVEHLPPHVTGADIYAICSNSWLEAARKYIREISRGKKAKLPVVVDFHNFKYALANFVPSLTPAIIKNYEKYRGMDQKY